MTFWGGSGSGSGSADPCLWLMDSDPDPEQDPDPYIWLVDPDPDPGGPKTSGSGGSGFESGSVTLTEREIFFVFFSFYVSFLTPLQLPPLRYHLCRRTLGSNPGLLLLWHWQPGGLTTRLDLIIITDPNPGTAFPKQYGSDKNMNSTVKSANLFCTYMAQTVARLRAGAENKFPFLCLRTNQIDKYRTETCCVIGNYYSLRWVFL